MSNEQSLSAEEILKKVFGVADMNGLDVELAISPDPSPWRIVNAMEIFADREKRKEAIAFAWWERPANQKGGSMTPEI